MDLNFAFIELLDFYSYINLRFFFVLHIFSWIFEKGELRENIYIGKIFTFKVPRP